MSERRAAALDRRERKHRTRLSKASTDLERLLCAVAWLVSEARKAHVVKDATAAVLILKNRVRDRLPLIEQPDQPAAADPTIPHVPWYELARGGGSTPSDSTRKERRE
jgi:hypothetical protein